MVGHKSISLAYQYVVDHESHMSWSTHTPRFLDDLNEDIDASNKTGNPVGFSTDVSLDGL